MGGGGGGEREKEGERMGEMGRKVDKRKTEPPTGG